LSNYDSRLQWTTGVFYQKREGYEISQVTLTNISVPGTDIVVFPETELYGVDAYRKTEEYAVFGELYYDFTDRLQLTVGGRWFDFSIDEKIDSTGAIGTGPGELLKTSDDGIRPKVSLSYAASDDHMVYALASKGYRSGGVAEPVPETDACNQALQEAGLNSAPEGFDADSIWNYEIGLKSVWADGRASTNITAFYVDWSNIGQELNLRLYGDGTCAFSPTVNGGSATSQGIEFESLWNPISNLSLGLSFAYTDATFGEDTVAGEKGTKLPEVPEWTASAFGEYVFALNDGMDMFLRADYQYVDERRGEEQMLDSYDLVNLRAGIYKGPWIVSLFLNNATDSRPELGDRSFGSLFTRYTTLRPRTYGINLIWEF